MIELEPLSPELLKVAQEELNEVPSRVIENLLQFKEWISQQPHLKARDDDQLLIQFLRGSKYSMEQAKEHLNLYYTWKTKYPHLFSLTDISRREIKAIINLGCFVALPKPLNNNGPRIVVHRYNFSLPPQDLNDVICFASGIMDLTLINDPYACIHGVIYIFDMTLYTSNHFLHAPPALLKKLLDYFTKTMPLRIKAGYVVNTSPISMKIYKLLEPFLPKKIRERAKLCSDVKELASHLPLEFLPKDYGGENGSFDELNLEWQKIMNDNAIYLKENAEYGVDESKRLGDPIDFKDNYGMDGTFRKLEMD